MVKLKKYPRAVKQFGLFLTFALLVSCGAKNYCVNRVEGREIGVTENAGTKTEIENFIKPYRDKIDKDMNVVLAVAPQTLDKSGQWQTTIGNMMADAAIEFGNRVFAKRENKNIDISLLNFGGIRSIIPKGNVTTRTAFEVMPFENRLVVAALKGDQIIAIVDYIIAEKKAHPLAGLTFTIGKDKSAKNISVNGKPLDINQIYHVVTSDYLINGGDKMNFFKNAVTTYDLDYKLRNVLIDYFGEVDVLPVKNDVRIKEE